MKDIWKDIKGYEGEYMVTNMQTAVQSAEMK